MSIKKIIFRQNHEQTNIRRKKEKEEDPDPENELQKEIIRDDFDEDDDFDFHFEEVDPEEHEKFIAGLNNEQRTLYNYVVGKMEEQETNRRLHGCDISKPCDTCDKEENLLRLFITGEGKR